MKPASAASDTGRRPMVSDSRPKVGWNDVDVSVKAVDSHEAALDARKYDVMTPSTAHQLHAMTAQALFARRTAAGPRAHPRAPKYI